MFSFLYYFVNSQFASLNRVIKKSILANHCIFNGNSGSEYIKILEYGCAEHFRAVSAITGLENSASEIILISSTCLNWLPCLLPKQYDLFFNCAAFH